MVTPGSAESWTFRPRVDQLLDGLRALWYKDCFSLDQGNGEKSNLHTPRTYFMGLC